MEDNSRATLFFIFSSGDLFAQNYTKECVEKVGPVIFTISSTELQEGKGKVNPANIFYQTPEYKTVSMKFRGFQKNSCKHPAFLKKSRNSWKNLGQAKFFHNFCYGIGGKKLARLTFFQNFHDFQLILWKSWKFWKKLAWPTFFHQFHNKIVEQLGLAKFFHEFHDCRGKSKVCSRLFGNRGNIGTSWPS